MRKNVVCIFIVALCVTLLGVPAAAQDDPMHGPPKVLSIMREEVKPGKAVAHEQHEAAWVQAFVKAKDTTPLLTLTSVTGPAEDWFLVGYESFAAMEKESERQSKDATLRSINATYSAKEAEFVGEARSVTARFRPELSYKPNFNVGEYKYFSVNLLRFRIGEDVDAFYKAINGAREKAGLDAHFVIYQVNSGMPSGTYIAFSPIKSMSEWDAPPNEALQAAYKEIGFSQMAGKALMNVENRVFAFAPQISIIPDEMAKANPDFWRPKQVMAKKATPAGEVTPAAKKEIKK